MENVIKPQSERSPLIASAIMAIVHVMLWTGLVVLPLLFVVPRYARVFADFGIAVPMVTQWVLMASVGTRAAWPVVPALLLGFLVVDGFVQYLLGQDPSAWRARWTWFALGVVVPLGLFLVSAIALWMSMNDLISRL